jgi:hypothetical protein
MSWRGIFLPEEDNPKWRSEVSQFENHVPRFDTKDECVAFMKRYFISSYHSLACNKLT